MLYFAHRTGNRLGNVDYLVACPETGEALAVDPWEPGPLLDYAKEQGWTIRGIVNTHSHWDHIRGNQELQESTGAVRFVHPNAPPELKQGATPLDLNARLTVGHCTLRTLDTPGHTMSHVCLLSDSETPFLLSGDTVFHAGAGNCHNGGDPATLFSTFQALIWPLPMNTVLLPGHDYRTRNLEFSLNREPGNERISGALALALSGAGEPSTLREEHEFNPFFRLDVPVVVEELKRAFPGRPLSTLEERFLAMRELRNHW